MQKPKAIDQLKKTWNENPLAVIGTAALAATAAAKLMDSVSSVQSRRAYAKQINRKKH